MAGVKMSQCRDWVAVAKANRAQRVSRLVESLSRPSSLSCSVWEGAQCPTMAAMASLWLLSSVLDCTTVRLECQAAQAIYRCTLSSAFQNCTSVGLSTPRALICLRTQTVLLARLIIFMIWLSHLKFDWICMPRIVSTFFSSNTFDPPMLNSGGKSYLVERENCMTKHFCWLIFRLFCMVQLWNLSSSS